MPGCAAAVTERDDESVYPITLDTVRLFLHVLAATIWVGGQLTLAALVPVLRSAGVPDLPKRVAQQFGRLAWAAFVVLLVTGVWNLEAYDHKGRSGYAATLGVKLTLVLLSGVAAAGHTRARGRSATALLGAATALFAVLALLWGVLLAQ